MGMKETTLSSTAIAVADSPRSVGPGWSNPCDRQSLYRDLNARLQAFTVEANSVLAAKAGEMVLSESRTRAYRHATLGPVMELVSSMHIPCDVDEGWRYMMSKICTGRPKSNDYGYRAQIQLNPELGGSKKEYSMELQDAVCAGLGCLSVEGFVVFDIYESLDWRLFIWSAVVSVHGDGTHAAGGCVLHRQYELYTASASAPTGGAGRGPPCAKTKFLAEPLLQKARHDCARVETTMAARFGSGASSVAALFDS